MRLLEYVVVVRIADTAEGAHAEADAARAKGSARGLIGSLGELRGWRELDARLELLERRQGERHRRAGEKGREECAREEGAQDGCERRHALRPSSAGAARSAPARTRDASYRAARRASQSRCDSGGRTRT